jgi:hypothetical protein
MMADMRGPPPPHRPAGWEGQRLTTVLPHRETELQGCSRGGGGGVESHLLGDGRNGRRKKKTMKQ